MKMAYGENALFYAFKIARMKMAYAAGNSFFSVKNEKIKCGKIWIHKRNKNIFLDT